MCSLACALKTCFPVSVYCAYHAHSLSWLSEQRDVEKEEEPEQQVEEEELGM